MSASSGPALLRILPEIETALQNGRPVVALESSVLIINPAIKNGNTMPKPGFTAMQ